MKNTPTIIERWQSFNNAGNHTYNWPKWIMNNILNGNIYAEDDRTMVKTSNGATEALDGDWICLYDDGSLEISCISPFN